MYVFAIICLCTPFYFTFMEDYFFNPDNYEKVKDNCTIEITSIDEGYGVKLAISKIGEIELTLPFVK